MADVRSLLRNERTARRITHPHATYSTTGTLVCLVCHIQLKSESLWNGHLRSSQHAMRLQRIRDDTLGRPPGAPAPESALAEGETEEANGSTPPSVEPSAAQSKKRKADDDEEAEPDAAKKRSKGPPLPGFLPEGFFDEGTQPTPEVPAPVNSAAQELKLPSRPATPLKTPDISREPAKVSTVDEDEWAAFEADIAAAEVEEEALQDAVISAAPMSTEEIAAKSREEEFSKRKERAEAELEGDKEDAVRKLEQEFEEMGELEERVKKLKEKREALRVKVPVQGIPASTDAPEISMITPPDQEEEEDEDDEEDDDDWAGFRLRG